jgi:hypothetical protein
MKKLTKSQLQTISKRLDNLFNQATDEEIKQGLAWYKEANEFVKTTYQYFNGSYSEIKIASVLSALSPRNKWATNKADTIRVLDAVLNNKQPDEIKVSTFHCNKYKAFEIAKGNTFIDISARKTFSFVNNIADLNPNYVTIDVWHLRACFNKTMGSIGNVAYGQIEKLTIKKATKYGFKGFEFQAILWVVIQRIF